MNMIEHLLLGGILVSIFIVTELHYINILREYVLLRFINVVILLIGCGLIGGGLGMLTQFIMGA